MINKISQHFKLNTEKSSSFSDLSILDVGCGGGLLCEPMARMGGKVTGIDASKTNIEVAKIHAQKMKIKIDYQINFRKM